jgi:hypothetical protein
MVTCANNKLYELVDIGYRTMRRQAPRGKSGMSSSSPSSRLVSVLAVLYHFILIFIAFRYGQKKPCFVYRLVMDNCLEKKIYDRQINKQGMADRVVDECNPDAHLSIKEVTNLCWDNEQDSEPRDLSAEKDKYIDVVMQKLLQRFGTRLSKVCLLLRIVTHIACFWYT